MDFKKYIDFGLAQGAEEIEIYLQEQKSEKLQVFKGQVDSLLSSKGLGVTIRAFTGGKMGFTYTSNLSDEGLKMAIKEAVVNAELIGSKEKWELPELYKDYAKVDIYDASQTEVTVEEKIAFALAAEKAALGYDPRIVSVPTVSYQDYVTEVQLVNSKGVNQQYRSTLVVSYASALAKENESTQTGMAVRWGRTIKGLNPEEMGKEAGKEAVALLGAKPVPSQKVPIIFKNHAGSSLFSSFAEAFLADKVQKGKSLFKGKIGQEVANPLVSLIDDALLAGGPLSTPFDDEGVPSRKTVVIENGILKNYLYDSHTAKIDGVQSTGNARKAALRLQPEPSITNFYLAEGDKSLEEMIASVKEGFLIVDLTGTHSGTNAVSGDFSVGANGIWIKDGKLAQPVREVTIAGNFGQFLNDIIEVGNDLEFVPFPGSMGTPSFMVKELAVSGS